jgi:hypothetical protein
MNRLLIFISLFAVCVMGGEKVGLYAENLEASLDGPVCIRIHTVTNVVYKPYRVPIQFSISNATERVLKLRYPIQRSVLKFIAYDKEKETNYTFISTSTLPEKTKESCIQIRPLEEWNTTIDIAKDMFPDFAYGQKIRLYAEHYDDMLINARMEKSNTIEISVAKPDETTRTDYLSRQEVIEVFRRDMNKMRKYPIKSIADLGELEILLDEGVYTVTLKRVNKDKPPINKAGDMHNFIWVARIDAVTGKVISNF